MTEKIGISKTSCTTSSLGLVTPGWLHAYKAYMSAKPILGAHMHEREKYITHASDILI